MSGIVAYHSKNPKSWHLDLVSNLMRNSTIRGTHSFGMSYEGFGRILSVKSLEIDDVVGQMGFPAFRENPPRVLIAGNIYAIDLNWKDYSNNPPLTIREDGVDYSMVADGIIDTDNRHNRERSNGRSYYTENDGEIVLREFIERSNEDWEVWFRRQKFAFAGAFLVEKKGLYIARTAKRPLWFTEVEDTVFYASTRDILKRSGAPGEYFQARPGKLSRYLIDEPQLS